MTHRIADLSTCAELRTIDAKANGYPRVGVHAGGGRHVPMTGDSASPGWTQYAHDYREHPTTKGIFAFPVSGLNDLTKLDAAESAKASEAKAAAVVLDQSWEPVDDTAEKPVR